ncbi:hypothetical protein RB195_007314 [Necator americanus]|uniref:Uncharacterized protein n=1 Tax=Necator americanus TaxID=51031 RepID=A0ABR1BZF9_NECAM
MENNHQYACREYWNERFLEEEQFEWLADFDAFKHLVLPHLKLDSSSVSGCGRSGAVEKAVGIEMGPSQMIAKNGTSNGSPLTLIAAFYQPLLVKSVT